VACLPPPEHGMPRRRRGRGRRNRRERNKRRQSQARRQGQSRRRPRAHRSLPAVRPIERVPTSAVPRGSSVPRASTAPISHAAREPSTARGAKPDVAAPLPRRAFRESVHRQARRRTPARPDGATRHLAGGGDPLLPAPSHPNQECSGGVALTPPEPPI
jgi:hypothetical protein